MEQHHRKDQEYISNVNVLIKEKRDIETKDKKLEEELDKHKNIFKKINEDYENSFASGEPLVK